MSFVRSLGVVTMRGVRGAAALAALAVLASCGGNVSRAEPYVPDKLVAFGDEMSLIESNGRKYTVNAVDATDTSLFVCAGNPIWSQYVAQGYGFVFSQCNPNNVTPTAFTYATVGATIDDVVLQVANHGVGFNSKTLVTVMVGTHDVLNAYAQVQNNLLSQEAALALMTTQGNRLGDLVNQITNKGDGARVLLALMPDVSYSPYAGTQEVSVVKHEDKLLAKLVKNLTDATRLRAVDNGRWIALITGNEIVSSMYKQPASYGLTDVGPAGCSVALPDCTTSTLNPSTVSTSPVYLWADDRRIAAAAHGNIGSDALRRAQNNPF
jgi:outer membrane lipase/esterase